MKYMGSKSRIAKEILPIMLADRKDGQFYIEPFVGGANCIDKVQGNRFGSDNNKYLIAMWKELQNGWIPPKEITREFYNECRTKYNKDNADISEWHIIGYVGFNASYGGRFYDGGYAGIVETKDKKIRNYPLEAYNNVMKQVSNIKKVIFSCGSYKEIIIPEASIVYCDIPYEDSKGYKTAKDFNKKEFCEWAKQKTRDGNTVYVSEYQMPDGFECVWQKEVSSSLRANGEITGNKKSVEKLFKCII